MSHFLTTNGEETVHRETGSSGPAHSPESFPGPSELGDVTEIMEAHQLALRCKHGRECTNVI